MLDVGIAIFKYFPHGGLQRDMMRCAVELLDRGHRVRLFCGSFEGNVPDKLELQVLPFRGWSNDAKARCFAAGLKEEWQRVPGSVLLAFNRIPGADYYFAADNCLKIHTAKYPEWYLRMLPRYRTFLGFEESIFGRGSKTEILYLTPQQKTDYQKFYQTEEARFHLLPPGIPPERKRPEESAAGAIRRNKRAELGVREEDRVLLEVGSGFRTKGVDLTIEALSGFPAELLQNTHLFIAGREKSAFFEKLARKRGIADHVHFLGGRDDVSELMLSADLLVHPARNEATGTVLIEALAAGLPVLCSPNCGFANYVREAGSAVLPENFRIADIAGMLTEILRGNRLPEMTAAARRYGKNADFYGRAAAIADYLEQGERHA